MKSYEEMVKNVFNRIDEYEKERKLKRNKIIKVTALVTPVFTAAAVGVGLWHGALLEPSNNQFISSKSESSISDSDIPVKNQEESVSSAFLDDSNDSQISVSSSSSKKQNVNIDDSNSSVIQTEPFSPNTDTSSSEQITVSVENGTVILLSSINFEGFDFIEAYGVDGCTFTMDKYLGTVGQFTGTYKPNYNSSVDSTDKVFTVKDNKYILLAVNSDGEAIALVRMGNIIINGKMYCETEINASDYNAESYIGIANDFEIITVPFGKTYISGDEEIFTVKENDDFLIFKSPAGEIRVFALA